MKTILQVEDDPNDVFFLQHAMDKAGVANPIQVVNDGQKAIDYFMANASKTEHDITVEVDRYIVWPGQALAYKIGELKLKEMRAFAAKELSNKFDIRQFHDEVLDNGALPLDILEKRIREWVSAQVSPNVR